MTSRAPDPAGPILLVEDDDAIRDGVAECLRLEGYPVAIAVNGADALAWLERGGSPSLVLLDVVMPVMNGTELLARMRLDPGLAAVPVVLMTAATQREPSSVPAQAFLAKPFDVAELLRTVARFYTPGAPG